MKTGALAGPAPLCTSDIVVDPADAHTSSPSLFSPTPGLHATPNPCAVTEGAASILKIMLPPDLAAVRQASITARQFLRTHRVAEEIAAACELALVEACNNAILYATDAARSTAVELRVCSEADWLEMQVIDHTDGFDWPAHLELPDPDSEHGRGLFIIQSLMDETAYLRGLKENRLIMRKQRKVSPPPALDEAENLPVIPDGLRVIAPLPSGEMEQKLAISEQVINTITQELCEQIVQAREQQEQLDNRLLLHELEIARNIQQSLLPKAFPALTGYRLAGFCRSARQVGGDFYDVLPLGQDLVLLVVADVMGKGVPAALFAATLRTLIRTTAEWTQSPAELLSRINRLMFDELSSVDMFITAQLVLVDARQRRLTVASAGHCPLLLVNSFGETAPLSPEGMPLGIISHIQFTDQIVSLDPFHCMLLYTDGLTEARNPEGQWFGHERLVSWLGQGASSGWSADEFSDSFLSELNSFQANSALRDDQTFLILSQESASAPNPS